METNYTYAIKNQRGASNNILRRAGSSWQLRAGVATLWSSRPMRAKPRHSSTNESGPGWPENPVNHCGRLWLALLHHLTFGEVEIIPGGEISVEIKFNLSFRFLIFLSTCWDQCYWHWVVQTFSSSQNTCPLYSFRTLCLNLYKAELSVDSGSFMSKRHSARGPIIYSFLIYAIKTQEKATNIPLGSSGCLELCLYGIRELTMRILDISQNLGPRVDDSTYILPSGLRLGMMWMSVFLTISPTLWLVLKFSRRYADKASSISRPTASFPCILPISFIIGFSRTRSPCNCNVFIYFMKVMSQRGPPRYWGHFWGISNARSLMP